MAKVKITGHASGSGVITVTAPNTSTDRTITLPDSTATLATTTEVALKAPLASPEFTGNVGIGATPHDTHAAFDTIEFDRGSIISQSTATSGHFITGSNMYYSSGGGPAYQITAAATTITQLGGEILLQVAPSGSADAAISWTTAMTIDNTGAVTMPLQPAFSVKPTSTQSDIAVGSQVTMVLGTEIFDQNSDFASNTFTAPVSGKYQLNLSLYLTYVDEASSYYIISMSTSNRAYECVIDPGALASDPVYWHQQLSVLADMDANDTVYIFVHQGSGTAQTDLSGNSYFSGYLVC